VIALSRVDEVYQQLF